MAGHPGEKITEGLEGLWERLAEYSRMGARFAKWRAVIAIGDGLPSHGCIDANVDSAQLVLSHPADCNRAARRGDYSPAMESTEVESVGGQR